MVRYCLWTLLVGIALLQCGCAGIRPPPGAVMTKRTLLTTGYCGCGKCCDWQRKNGHIVDRAGRPKHVGITASGSHASRGTIAADTRVYPFGTVMEIPGYGYGRVEDRGGAIKGDHVDLYFGSHKEALRWGKQLLRVKIWIKRMTTRR